MQLRRPLALWKVPPWPGNASGKMEAAAPIILLYHSVAKVSTDPWGVRVKPRNFIEQMAVIRKHCHALPLAKLDEALRTGGIPPRTVLITFDDGYVDNLEHAKPAMEKYGVPGTVFVSSGYVDAPFEYWWDELDRLVLQPGTLNDRVSVTVAGKRMEWTLGDDARLTWGGMRWHHHGWYAYEEARRMRPRQILFYELWAALRAAPSVAERERAIDELRQQAKPAVEPRPSHRCCTSEQVRELARGGIVEVGAHTVHHPSLGHIGVEEQRDEIVESKQTLERILQCPVRTFSYPFGTRADYSASTVSLLKEAGFHQACSNFPETLLRNVDRFQYPRRVVDDWSGEKFAAKLAGWFADDARTLGISKT